MAQRPSWRRALLPKARVTVAARPHPLTLGNGRGDPGRKHVTRGGALTSRGRLMPRQPKMAGAPNQSTATSLIWVTRAVLRLSVEW